MPAGPPDKNIFREGKALRIEEGKTMGSVLF
jgi:hypothetical protein